MAHNTKGTGITREQLQEAWKLRNIGVYTIREVANKLGVNREELIAAMQADVVQKKETNSE